MPPVIVGHPVAMASSKKSSAKPADPPVETPAPTLPAEPAEPPRGPVNTTSKVTVAFPFSTIRMEEDTEKLAALAAIVADLAAEVGHLAPSKPVAAIQQRAADLLASLE